jgi:hypothetical protein
MHGELVPIIIVPAIFFAFAYMVKVISDNSARKALINSQTSVEAIDKLFLQNRAPDLENALKWGLVIVGIGVAFIALQVMSFDADEPISYGLIFLFGGGGLLAYYGIGTVSNK